MSKKHYTTFDIARICDVQPATVAYWIEQGQLHAHKTPGGHRRVTPDNLYLFLRSHNMPVPDDMQREHRPRVLLIKETGNGSMLLPAVEDVQQDGLDVKTADNRFQSGVLMIAFKPQCVVIELGPSIADPAAYCREILAANANGKMTLIVVGHDLSHETIHALQSAGVADYIDGRIDARELFDKIQRILV